MDLRNFIRPIIAGLVGIGVIVLIIVIFSKIFGGHDSAPASGIDLGKYANTSSSATLLIDSPTNLNQDHRQVKITVTGTQNRIDIIEGYQDDVIDSRTYDSNEAAYGAFLQSLKLMNYSKGDSSASARDYRGYCPTGARYVYGFNDGNKDLFTYWSTSCHSGGTFKGTPGPVRLLFERQIPDRDFQQLTSSIPLN